MAEKPGKRRNTGSGVRRADRPETAAGEALREFENAETDVAGTVERRHRGEAGEAITPNTRAQEESEGDCPGQGPGPRRLRTAGSTGTAWAATDGIRECGRGDRSAGKDGGGPPVVTGTRNPWPMITEDPSCLPPGGRSPPP
ncbi:hypothetical protein ACIQCF_10895 [Streptomyces sp. NPDC088353]|uniref:hypothetical protein n=1 Tax=Streptomyces sp. NPDC088353 TaxID=3365855 RepID=UPI0037F6FB58